MSDEGDAADDAASDGSETDQSLGSAGSTAVVTKSVTRPQRPTGKRSRQKAVGADEESSAEVSQRNLAQKDSTQKDSAQKANATKKSKKASKRAGSYWVRVVKPIAFVYTYLKQVVAEMRKVIWPNRKQMLTYTSVVLAFLAFMVALVGLADVGLTKLVLLVFG